MSRLRYAHRVLGIEQGFRLLACAFAAACDGIWTSIRGSMAPADVRRANRDAFRERTVARVVRTLGTLKGPFAKAGQFAANRHDVLPPFATEALASLRDRVPPIPPSQLRSTLEAELGRGLTDLFTAFDPEPLGAASIAQVHRATLPDGTAVAVKVQYPWLEASLAADLFVLRVLLALWSRLGGPSRSARARLHREFETGLREELDFAREARMAGEIGANLSRDPQIVVPRVIEGYSSGRVLTVEYHAAVAISDRCALDRLQVTPRTVLEILIRAYTKQMFVDGLFHADPHPGNLFILDEPGARERPRLLFVDFGLSKRLDPQLRREIRRGIYALMQRDLDAFIAAMDRMKMVESGHRNAVRAAVASMFERIGGGLEIAGSRVLPLKDEAKALLQTTPGLQLPNDLLLYAKTLAYVFALGAELDPDVDLMRLSLPALLRFLAEPTDEKSGSARR